MISYPYLTFAREHGVDYGRVLDLVDRLEYSLPSRPELGWTEGEFNFAHRFNAWRMLARRQLGNDLMAALEIVIRNEYVRRGAALPAVAPDEKLIMI
jgi:hypothetical protein